MALHTYGTMGVDWEQRVRFDRLREERLARIKAELAASDMGALLCFDMTNIRYITATHIGTWAQDKLNRFCLLPQGDEPIMWDFGSAARHHAIYCPWLGEDRSRAGISTLRGAMSPESGRAESVASKIRVELEERGLLNEPVGVDAIEPAVLFALQAEGIQIVDGQQLMQQARVIKTQDEITLLNTACAMVDAAYEELYRAMRPGIRENECVALVNKVLYDMGSEFVEGVNAISGERCSPHPHVFTDRALRPGDPAYFDILHSFNGYRTCYYRTFAIASASPALVDAYKRCRYYLDAAIDRIRPGVTTGEVVEVWPEAQEFGFPDEEAAFALQFGHGVGLSIWEKPVFSRLVSLDHPEEIKEGMVFALETFWPASRRLERGAHRGAARRDRGRLRGDHALPRRGPGHRRQAVLHGRRHAAARARGDVRSQHDARRQRPRGDAEPQRDRARLMAATLRDVARLAAVHPGTVSRALNPETRRMVNEETARRVLEAAATLDYRPNPIARGLKTNRSYTIGVLVPDLTNPLFPPIVRGIQDKLEQAGYTPLIANTDNDPDRERNDFEAMRARQVDGVITATARLDHGVLDEMGNLPIVLVNRRLDDGTRSSATADDHEGARLAVAHLAARGHTRIAHLGGPQDVSTGRLRSQGYLDGMTDAGLEPGPVLTGKAFTEPEGARLAGELVDEGATAIVAGNDLMALGCYDVFAERGIRCPDDIAVVGFNDMPFSERFNPPLTTIRIPHYEIGAAAAELLLERLQDPDAEPRHVELAPELVVRESA